MAKETRYCIQIITFTADGENFKREKVSVEPELEEKLKSYLFSCDLDDMLKYDAGKYIYGYKVTLETAEFGVNETADYPKDCRIGEYNYDRITSRDTHRVIAERIVMYKDGNIVKTEKVFDPEVKEAAISLLKGTIEEYTKLLHRIENT